MSCVVALAIAFLSSAAFAAKSESKRSKHESAPAVRSEPSDWSYVPGIFYGSKSLDKKDWLDMNAQAETGFSLAIQHAEWPLALVVEYSKAEESGKDVGGLIAKGETTEIGLGLRFGIGDGNDSLKYFAEGGLVQISGNGSYIDAVSGEYYMFSGSTIGHWLGVGLDYMVTSTLSVGLEGRYSAGIVKAKYEENNLFDPPFEDVGIGYEMGGSHLGVTLRYRPE